MKKIIITGGRGFIGSNLVNFFLKKNYKIFDIDHLSYCSTPLKFNKSKYNKNYIFIKANIGNFKKIQKIFKSENIHAIFNLAANSHVDRSIDSPKKFFLDNVISSLNFIDGIFLNKKKGLFNGQLINISTDEVYGDIKGLPSTENSKICTNSPYSASKASVENIFQAYSSTFKVPFKNIRCCNNYGPYQHPEKFIPTVILNCLKGCKIPLYGNGLQSREWIFVEDFCEAINHVYKKGLINQIYNVGSNNRLTNIKLAKIIIKKLQSKGFTVSNKLINFVKDRPGHDKVYKINSKKLRNLKWKNKINFQTGIEKTIDWYLDNKNWLEYMGKTYQGQRLGLNK